MSLQFRVNFSVELHWSPHPNGLPPSPGSVPGSLSMMERLQMIPASTIIHSDSTCSSFLCVSHTVKSSRRVSPPGGCPRDAHATSLEFMSRHARAHWRPRQKYSCPALNSAATVCAPLEPPPPSHPTGVWTGDEGAGVGGGGVVTPRSSVVNVLVHEGPVVHVFVSYHCKQKRIINIAKE